MIVPNPLRLYRGLLIIASSVLTIACNSNKHGVRFDKGLWKQREDIDYPDVHFPHRDKMLDDLVKNHKLKGLTYQQLIDSLGAPGNFGDNDDTVRYEIFTGFESDIDPTYGKNLNLTLGADSVVTSYKISEWKHN